MNKDTIGFKGMHEIHEKRNEIFTDELQVPQKVDTDNQEK